MSTPTENRGIIWLAETWNPDIDRNSPTLDRYESVISERIDDVFEESDIVAVDDDHQDKDN